MIICHGSDWHGCKQKINDKIVYNFPEINSEFDVFVMSGDFCPNLHWGPYKNKQKLKEEKQFQEHWVHENALAIKNCIKDKPFLFCSGNHDFINPCEILKKYGINAINLDNEVIYFLDYYWYGFPYIPYLNDNWNFERNSQQMRQEILKFINKLKNANIYNSLDILVAHAPLYGILDKSKYYGENIGNTHMNSALTYQINKIPKIYLHGHCHEMGNQIEKININEKEIIISNAATGYNILEI